MVKKRAEIPPTHMGLLEFTHLKYSAMGGVFVKIHEEQFSPSKER